MLPLVGPSGPISLEKNTDLLLKFFSTLLKKMQKLNLGCAYVTFVSIQI